jgi:7-cyano-7-deazaguanine synthase
MKAFVLLSGGVDSTTCLAIAIKEHGIEPKDITSVSLHYGQKHEMELIQAREVSRFYGTNILQKELDSRIFASEQSSLTGNREMPHETYQELMSGDGPSPTYVPFRNANLLSVATSLALTADAGAVYFGAHAEDAHNWAYPDCTPEFIGAMANAIFIGTYYKVRLVAPVEHMMKKDIVKKGLELGVPYEITHSCYEGRRPACGKCPTCVERLEAFRANGVEDPLEYDVEGEVA